MRHRSWRQTVPDTQETIADVLGVPKMTISDTIAKYEKRQVSDFVQDFTPYLYNIWSQPRALYSKLSRTHPI